MNDNGAVLKGYTKSVIITGGDSSFAALVKPDTDYEGKFRAYDTDNQEWLIVCGWNCDVEEI